MVCHIQKCNRWFQKYSKTIDAQSSGTASDDHKRLFKTRSALPKSGRQEKCAELIQSNELFFAADLVKEMLNDAYQAKEELVMAEKITNIIGICDGTGNKLFKWFANLLLNHFKGMIAHASIPVSSGKMEGTNNKIKTIRRQAYGFPDDEYFFLKIIDSSRKTYVRNPKSHNFFH